MNTRFYIANLVLIVAQVAAFAPAQAKDTPSDEPSFTVDCTRLSLPRQSQVAEVTDQSNFSQVYVTRTKLMGEIRRLCHRNGTAQVRVRVVRGDSTAKKRRPQQEAEMASVAATAK